MLIELSDEQRLWAYEKVLTGGSHPERDAILTALRTPAPEPAAGERGWREFYDEVMRRAEQEDDATVYADRIAYHLDIVAEEWGLEGESND